MQQPFTEEYFGLVIAYLLPGATLLFGLSFISPTVENWLIAPPSSPPSLAGFLFGSVAGLMLGLVVHGIRVICLDRTLYPLTGLKRPNWRDDELHHKVEAFNTLVENQFRYHQFWGGMFLSLPGALALRRLAEDPLRWPVDPLEWVVLGLVPLCWHLSRTALRGYYNRTSSLLGITPSPKQESEPHHGRTCVLQLHGPDQQPPRPAGPEDLDNTPGK